MLPVLLALALLFIAGARLSSAAGTTDAAAQAAARAASLARTPDAGQAAAVRAAERVLADQEQGCAGTAVEADTSGLAVPVGQASEVTVTVRCTVPLGDLFFLKGGPGTKTVESTFTSVVDAYRTRG